MKRKTSQLLKLLGGLPFWVKGNSLKISFWVFDVSCQFQGEKLYFNKPNKEHGLNPSIFVSYRICFQTNHLIIQNISTDGDSQPCVVVPSHPVHHRPDHVRRNPEGNHQETPWRLDRGWNLLFTIVMITNMIETIIMITDMMKTIIRKRKKIIPKSLFDSSVFYNLKSVFCILCFLNVKQKDWRLPIFLYNFNLVCIKTK